MEKPTQQQWQDSRSGPGHMQTVPAPALSALNQAYRALLDHTTGDGNGHPACAECRTGGMDCEAAAELRKAWREARNAEARVAGQ